MSADLLAGLGIAGDADRDLSDEDLPFDLHLGAGQHAIAPSLPDTPLDIAAIGRLLAPTDGVDAGDPTEDPLGLQQADPPADERREVIFVDSATPDLETLLADFGRDRDDVSQIVVLLNSASDPLQQIADHLSAMRDIDAVHIVSHASTVGLALGGKVVDLAAAESARNVIETWGVALTDGADLLIYGCDFAATEDGRTLASLLAKLTGADVAASTDLTGAAAAGSDWELEYRIGDVTTAVALSAEAQVTWSHTLLATDGLLLSIEGDEVVPDEGAVDRGEVLQFADPGLSFDSAGAPANTTTGTYSSEASFGALGLDLNVDIDALHYVSQDITVGSSTTFDLLEGDLLLSTEDSELLTSINAISVDKEDVFVYRPDTPGDYSAGRFFMLLNGFTSGGKDVDAISLVEANTIVGEASTVLAAGTFLFAQDSDGGFDKEDILHYTPTTVGSGAAVGTIQTLIDGGEIDISDRIYGLDLVEQTITIAGSTLNAGTILVSIDADAEVGDNELDVTKQDIFGLNISRTTLGSGSGNEAATAFLFFDGSDVGLTQDGHDLDATALLTSIVNNPPSATNLTSTSSYTEGDASVTITDIVVSDADAGDVVTATLTLADKAAGSLTANDGASYDADTGGWSITGTVAAVNTALANLAFLPATENNQDTTIAVSIDDGDEDGSGPLTGTITLDVTPVNDAPSATNLTSTSNYAEGTASVAITDIVVSDVDTGDLVTATLTLADTGAGSLTVNDGASYDADTG
ncbi:MAG: DUF4347 domain-containing protein, partial [Alphaproteobacteria bacterium]